MENGIKVNNNNDYLYRKDLILDKPEPQGQVFKNLEEAAKTIKPEEVEYITD